MSRIIMHQSTVGQASRAVERAVEHLDAEWRLFQSFDADDDAVIPVCRTWEAAGPIVVVGRHGSVADQVFESVCARDGVPVIRRQSGGGAVVLGPGCLNYAMTVSLVSHPELADVSVSFRTILGWIAEALGVGGLTVEGGTDLALNGRKVSGNAQRRGRRALLHHGTLLYAFDPSLASRYLRDPSRQPAYRARRDHAAFLTNLPLSRAGIEDRLIGAGIRF